MDIFEKTPFPKDPFSEEPKRVVSKRVVLADCPPERKPERGYIRMFPRNENWNEGTFACCPERKPEQGYIRQNRPFTKPPFYLPVTFFRSLKPRHLKIRIFEEIWRGWAKKRLPRNFFEGKWVLRWALRLKSQTAQWNCKRIAFQSVGTKGRRIATEITVIWNCCDFKSLAGWIWDR